MKSRNLLEPPALELVEESVQLLRRAPAATLVVYYAGTVPFVLGGLYFWAHTTWFAPRAEQVAWAAFGLVVLYAAMKTAHAAFCARLLAQRFGAAPPAWHARKWLGVGIAQLRLQPWAFVATLFALVLTIPLGWVLAYTQNLSVLGEGDALHRDAVEQAKLWPRQNHTALAVLAALAFAVALNLAVGFAAVPWLANRLLGVENIFGFSGWWFFNSTFLASIAALTWLVVDPLLKAFYTLRVFHGRARRTGEDLRVDLELARRLRAPARVTALLILAGLVLGEVAPARAATSDPAPVVRRGTDAIPPAELDRAIDTVLEEPEFRWRLRRREPEAKPGDGPLTRFVRVGLETGAEILRGIGRTIGAMVDWFEERFLRDQRHDRGGARGAGDVTVLRLVLYVFIAVAIGLIGWLIFLLIRGAVRQRNPAVLAQAVASATPDLRDEQVQAAQLPVEGWLVLAREQAQRGEWRLAWRALYLATLARLAADGLVSLAKFKTNLDYEREVRRRALSRAEIVAAFAARRRQFEDVWYGRAEPGEAQVRAWLTEFER